MDTYVHSSIENFLRAWPKSDPATHRHVYTMYCVRTELGKTHYRFIASADSEHQHQTSSINLPVVAVLNFVFASGHMYKNVRMQTHLFVIRSTF